MYRVAVVNSRSFGTYAGDLLEKLKEAAQVDRIFVDKDIGGKELAERLRGYHFVVASVTPFYGREFFENNVDVLMIARHGVGVDNVDVKAATEHGVLVTRVPGYKLREAVAEMSVALALAAVRRLCAASSKVREGKWKERGMLVGFNIKGKTVGILGLGNIGGRVAEIYRFGFGANVLGYDPFISPEEAKKRGARLVGFEELLRESDIISIHVPLTAETRHMIGEREFNIMKRGVVLVNAARGAVVDTEALIKALREGRVGAAALDVVEGEPIDASHPLLSFENVIITPHIGSNTVEALRGMDEANIEAILSVINGKVPEGLVNPEVLKLMARAKLDA